jgi:broad specificity phosphatase PhoE
VDDTHPASTGAAARLLLVRHGQIAANVDRRWHGSTDEDLTDEGRDEARRVAAHIVRAHPQVVALYSSPARRALDTAAPIAAALGLDVRVAGGLAEYGIGVFENETYADLVGRHRFFELSEADTAWAPSGGESLRAVGTRVVGVWREIAAAHPTADVVVVSHGAAIATGLSCLLHDDPRGWYRYHVRNGSVTELVLEPTPRLLAFDLVEHLA